MSIPDPWSIVEPAFNPATFKAYEGLFTLGSGYLHVRGSLEEHLSGAPQNTDYTRLPANVTSEKFREAKSKWGTYIPGIFGKHPLLNNEMINLPWFLGMTPIIDGEPLDMEQCAVEDYRRELRLDTAALIRSLTWRTRSKKTVTLRWERFISATRTHLAMQRMWLETDAPADLELRAGIDADVRTNGYDHFASVNLITTDDNIACIVRTDAGDEIAIASTINGPVHTDWHAERGSRSVSLVGRRRIEPGPPVVFDKRTIVRTSRDPDFAQMDVDFEAMRHRPYAELFAEHAEAWRGRWASCDVIVEGDPDSQQALRVSLYHLLRAHVAGDARVAIDAKGYAGEAYWGRYFWDTELYLLPFFLYTDPGKARTLTDFRLQSLPGARANAACHGYPGARYAWESDAEGYECCPNWQYADHEVHVTADVVYGLVHYAEATDQHEYLAAEAADVIIETARYWAARVDQRPGDDYMSLLGVMGPDEYTPICNNNSYTNRMAGFALEVAAQVGEAVGLPREEYERFGEIGESLPVIYDEDNELILQCEGFNQLADPRFAELWKDRSRAFAAQVSQERLYRSKCLKQADALLLMMLFPEQFTEDEVRRAWDYYLPYTTHDSSLSAGVHAILALRLGLPEEAWKFWQMGRAVDLDIAHGGAAEGIHIANAGAVWQMAVFGFAGMLTAVQSEILSLHPQLPAAWSRLAFPIIWKNRPVWVDITRAAVTVTNRGEDTLEIEVNHESKPVGAGETATWPMP